MIDIDTYREILDTLTRNKSRSLLTGFGVFWGVFMLIFLIGGGQGVKEVLSNQFDGFATNMVMVFSQSTTKAYDGFRKGRQWSMTDTDLERLRQQIPELDVVTPMVFGESKTATNDTHKSLATIKGVKPDYAKVQAPKLYYGRYLNEMDERTGRKVCVIGKKIYKDLFSDGINPCGRRIRVGDIYYEIVGVDWNSSSVNMGGEAEKTIIIPFSACRQMYNFGNTVHIICITGRGSTVMSSVTERIRTVIARAHRIDPTDEQAVSVFNTEELFQIMDSLFRGVNYLIWLIGLGTILAGAIGVSNIMMVTVKERTTEIGIRRAIGATPRMILSQLMMESLVLTAVAGMSGILFGILLLQLLEMGMTEDGIVTAHFQVGFWTAIFATAFLSLIGLLSGLAPAFRAMRIKPVDAMREE